MLYAMCKCEDTAISQHEECCTEKDDVLDNGCYHGEGTMTVTPMCRGELPEKTALVFKAE